MTAFHGKASFLVALITFFIFTFFVSRYCAIRDDLWKKSKRTRGFIEKRRYQDENSIRKTHGSYEFEENDFDEVKGTAKLMSGEYSAGVREINTNRAKRSVNPFAQNQFTTRYVDESEAARSKLVKYSRNKLYSWENKVKLRETGWSMRKDRNVSKNKGKVKRSSVASYVDRNSTEYYEQRKAIMQRFYARQREINEKYKKIFSTSPRPLYIDLNAYANTTILPKTYELLTSEKSTTSEAFDNANSKFTWTGHDANFPTRNFVTEASNVSPKNNSTAVNQSQNFLPKHQKKSVTGYNDHRHDNFDNENNEEYDDDDDNVSTYDNRSSQLDATNNNDIQRWGTCTGTLVYQHNLLLGLNGPSNLNAIFEVIIENSVCITCVEAHRYNQTRATVTLDFGGRGFKFAKLKLQGFENEAFSYIIKVWAVKKVQQDCRAQIA